MHKSTTVVCAVLALYYANYKCGTLSAIVEMSCLVETH